MEYFAVRGGDVSLDKRVGVKSEVREGACAALRA